MAPDSLGLAGSDGKGAARGRDLATMEPDHGRDAEITAGRHGPLYLCVEGLDFGYCLVPAPRIEKQLTQDAMSLHLAEHHASPVC